MPEMEKDEGLVLRSLDFRDRQKILTLFTENFGMISLIVKGIHRKSSHLLTLTSPFTRGEYLFRVGKSHLFAFKDGTPLATNHALRANLTHIEAATALVKALLDSQLPEKPAPALYQLTKTYLEILPDFEEPNSLIASFLLKLLKHEGHLSLHHPPAAFSPKEWETATLLTQVRTIQKLKETTVSTALHKKIEEFFKQTSK